MVANQIRREEDEFVVELGAGTGAVTRALLSAGVPADKLIVVEIDPRMATALRKAFPGATVVEGSAFDLADVLPKAVVGKVGTVVCGIPVSILPLDRQRGLTRLMLSLMPAGRRIVQYSFRMRSPLRAREIGLRATRLGFTLNNIPPASVWGYEATAAS